jgi:hypothetical protein
MKLDYGSVVFIEYQHPNKKYGLMIMNSQDFMHEPMKVLEEYEKGF